MANEAPIAAGGDAAAHPAAEGDGTNALPKLTEIPEEKDSEYVFVFPSDGDKSLPVPESWKRLCGFIQDFPIVDKRVPLDGYYAADVQLMKDVADQFRVSNPDEYLKALNGKTAEIEITATPECLNNVDDQTRIRAANLSDFLSIALVKRVILSWFAEAIMNTTPDSVDKITAMLGSKPLDIEDIRQYGLENERSLWEVYPREYERIFGHKLDEAPTSSDGTASSA
uniref:Tail assembly chaperone n=1 Tax=Panagrellus redivivus TaxID=6233 RepID=A0A7E4ZW95_PANRE